MAFENVELFDRIAEDALEKYGWQDRDESKLIVLSENATYMVRNKQNGKDGNNYFCVICEYLSGSAPDENNEAQMVRQFRYLGETTAYLHRQTEIWNGTSRLERIEWNYDTIIGEHAAWGRWNDFRI